MALGLQAAVALHGGSGGAPLRWHRHVLATRHQIHAGGHVRRHEWWRVRGRVERVAGLRGGSESARRLGRLEQQGNQPEGPPGGEALARRRVEGALHEHQRHRSAACLDQHPARSSHGSELAREELRSCGGGVHVCGARWLAVQRAPEPVGHGEHLEPQERAVE